MNDLFFTDRNGNPITGKVPVQVRVYGQGDEVSARRSCEGAFAAFVEEIRLGGLNQHQRAFIVPGICSARFAHIFGTTTVDIHLVPGTSEANEEFYGGIVVKLVEPTSAFASSVSTYLSTFGTTQFTWPFSVLSPSFVPPAGTVYMPAPPRTLVSSAPFANTAVPTQLDTARPAVKQLKAGATRLVFQIEQGVAFGVDPVKTKKIRVFRIGDAVLGPVVEASTEHRYLLNATLTGSVLGNWAIAGKQVTWIPDLTIAGTTSPLRLCTMLFQSGTFTTAKKTRGFVIVAVGGKLYIFGPGLTTWFLLASTPDTSSLWNVFSGSTTTTVSTTGDITLNCTGTNYAGPCSAFQVTLAKSSTGYNVSGTISLAAVGLTLPALISPTSSRTITATHTAGSTRAVTWERTLQTFDFFGSPIGPFYTTDTLFTWEPRNYSTTTVGTVRQVSLGHPTGPDPFTPRTTPGQQTVAAEFNVTSSASSTSNFITAEFIHTYDPAGWEFDEWLTHWAFLEKVRQTNYSASLVVTSPHGFTITDVGSRTLTTYQGLMTYGIFPGDANNPPTVNPAHSPTSSTTPTMPSNTSSGGRTRGSRSSFSHSFDGTHYTATDAHGFALALSRRVTQSFSLAPHSGVTTYTPDLDTSGAQIGGARWYYTTGLGWMVQIAGTDPFVTGAYGWDVTQNGVHVYRGVVRAGVETLTDLSSTMHSSMTTAGDYFTPAGNTGAVMSEVPSGYMNGPGGVGSSQSLGSNLYSVSNWWSQLITYNPIVDTETASVGALGGWNHFEYSTPSASPLQALLPSYSYTSGGSSTTTNYSQSAWQSAFPSAYYPLVTESWQVSPATGGRQNLISFEPGFEQLTPSGANCAPFFDCVLRDMRTTGFIKQQIWAAKSSVSPSVYTMNNSITIGNDVDEVSLLSVVNEWLTLNAASSTTFAMLSNPLTEAFVHPDTLEVSLL